MENGWLKMENKRLVTENKVLKADVEDVKDVIFYLKDNGIRNGCSGKGR